MKPHTLTTDWRDQHARVLALDFATQRVVVQWGDLLTCWTTGYELRPDGWHRFQVSQAWHASPARACAEGGKPLGRCLDFDNLLISPAGPGTGPLVRWLRDEAARLERENRAKDEQARAIKLVGGRYTQDQQDQLQALRFDPDLPTSLIALSAGTGTLAVVGDLLARVTRRLVHGTELIDLGAYHHTPLFGPADVDGVLRPLVACGLVRPYCYDPKPGTAVGESCGLLSRADQRRFATQGGWLDHGLMHWYLSAGPRIGELPEYSL